ncbi:uncharacterized protein [Lolium perenne]|uniref:uncharacterized protein isoform X2 n=1 Tax=Lolium perenne TaxID=4522 RepID=UPI0021F5C359|nr:uncharacterized protein LOC127331730 isoform X3 [Lolium perenne]XP_051213872.1 uncharacterized protein LOC127331730 isoform X3 [Lolium perenne]XP_051213873.1 uncharacterized protein LOC127331730 isoform X3 [Lolium perenne]
MRPCAPTPPPSVVRPQTPFATTAGPPPTAGGKGGGVPVHHYRGSSAVRVRLAAPVFWATTPSSSGRGWPGQSNGYGLRLLGGAEPWIPEPSTERVSSSPGTRLSTPAPAPSPPSPTRSTPPRASASDSHRACGVCWFCSIFRFCCWSFSCYRFWSCVLDNIASGSQGPGRKRRGMFHAPIMDTSTKSFSPFGMEVFLLDMKLASESVPMDLGAPT